MAETLEWTTVNKPRPSVGNTSSTRKYSRVDFGNGRRMNIFQLLAEACTHVRSLVDRGANINKHSAEGFLPLCNAAFWGYADIAELLLKNGADINMVNSGTGWTACHCAAFQAHGKVLMKLMLYKPDLNIKDTKGRTAFDFASAVDTVWPFFAAEGCERTSKGSLISLGVIRKVPNHHDQPTTLSTGIKQHLAHYSRPGSAYVMRDPSDNPIKRDRSKISAAQMGDVLSLEEEPNNNLSTRDTPKFTIWKT